MLLIFFLVPFFHNVDVDAVKPPTHQRSREHRTRQWRDSTPILRRISAFSDLINFRFPESTTPQSFLSFQEFSKPFGFTGAQKSGSRPGRARHLTSGDEIDFGLDTNELQDGQLLDVRDPDSPYGLIQEVLSNKPQPVRWTVDESLGGLRSQEVWLADGDLLVLKGGIPSSENIAQSWPPLDDYEAPYREPIFPPENAVDEIVAALSNRPTATQKPVEATTAVPVRVITNEFKPSLQISPFQVYPGFQPVTPRAVPAAVSSQIDSNRINRQTGGFASLLSNVPKQSSSVTSTQDNYRTPRRETFQTVIHGVYPRIVPRPVTFVDRRSKKSHGQSTFKKILDFIRVPN